VVRPNRARLRNEKYDLPDDWEVNIHPATASRCLFWSREAGDALALISGAVLLDMTVTVGMVRAAMKVLESYPTAAARSFWTRLRSLTQAPYEDTRPPLPETTHPYKPAKGKPHRTCSHLLHAVGRISCQIPASFKVEGVPGVYCWLHVRVAHGRARRLVEVRKKRGYTLASKA
jgi:hypothetical protein